MFQTLKYRDDIKLYDIIEIEYTKYVVISISYEEITCEPLERWIMRNSIIMYDGRYQSIMELVQDKTSKFISDRDRGLVAEYNMESMKLEISDRYF